MARDVEELQLEMGSIKRSCLSLCVGAVSVKLILDNVSIPLFAVRHRNKRNEILAKRVEALYYEKK